MILINLCSGFLILFKKINLKKFFKDNLIILILITSLDISIFGKLSYFSLLLLSQNIKYETLSRGLKLGIFMNIIIGTLQFLIQSDLNLKYLGEIDLSSNSFEIFGILRPYGLFEHPNIYGLSLLLYSIYFKQNKIQQIALLNTLSLQNLLGNFIINHKQKLSITILLIALIIKNPITQLDTFKDRIELIKEDSNEIKYKPWEIKIPHNIYQFSYEYENLFTTLMIIIFIYNIFIKEQKIGLCLIILSLLDHLIISQSFGLIFLCLIQTKTNTNSHYNKIKQA